MTTSTDEERLVDLMDRTHKLEVLDGLDKLKAKQERESRVAMKQRIKEEHHTIRVTRERDAFRFAEPITDLAAWYRFIGAAEDEELYPALKWSRMIRDGVLRRVGDGFVVKPDVADAKGYEIMEVS